MVQKHTFPQSGDRDDAENFAQLIGHDLLADYVGVGMGFNPDYTVPDVTIGDGLCFILLSRVTASSTGEDRLRANYAVQVAQDTIALTDGDVNHVYVEPDFGTDDNASYAAYTNTANASADALKIGEVDTANDTTTLTKRNPTIPDETGLGGDLLTPAGNFLWDETNGWIPADRIQQGDGSGLDADTIDGLNSDQLGVDFEHDDVTQVSNATALNASTGLDLSDDGDGTATIVVDDSRYVQTTGDALSGGLDFTTSGAVASATRLGARNSNYDTGDQFYLTPLGQASGSTEHLTVQWHDDSAGSTSNLLEVHDNGDVGVIGSLDMSGGSVDAVDTIDFKDADADGSNWRIGEATNGNLSFVEIGTSVRADLDTAGNLRLEGSLTENASL